MANPIEQVAPPQIIIDTKHVDSRGRSSRPKSAWHSHLRRATSSLIDTDSALDDLDLEAELDIIDLGDDGSDSLDGSDYSCDENEAGSEHVVGVNSWLHARVNSPEEGVTSPIDNEGGHNLKGLTENLNDLKIVLNDNSLASMTPHSIRVKRKYMRRKYAYDHDPADADSTRQRAERLPHEIPIPPDGVLAAVGGRVAEKHRRRAMSDITEFSQLRLARLQGAEGTSPVTSAFSPLTSSEDLSEGHPRRLKPLPEGISTPPEESDLAFLAVFRGNENARRRRSLGIGILEGRLGGDLSPACSPRRLSPLPRSPRSPRRPDTPMNGRATPRNISRVPIQEVSDNGAMLRDDGHAATRCYQPGKLCSSADCSPYHVSKTHPGERKVSLRARKTPHDNLEYFQFPPGPNYLDSHNLGFSKSVGSSPEKLAPSGDITRVEGVHLANSCVTSLTHSVPRRLTPLKRHSLGGALIRDQNTT